MIVCVCVCVCVSSDVVVTSCSRERSTAVLLGGCGFLDYVMQGCGWMDGIDVL